MLPKPPLVDPLDAWLLDEADDEPPDPRLDHDDPPPLPLRPEEQFCERAAVPACADGSDLQVLPGAAT